MIRIRWILFGTLVFLVGCQSSPEKEGSDFYHGLGGKEGIESFVEAYLHEVGTSAQLTRFYQDTKLARYKDMQFEYFCALVGGPCAYSGESLKAIHEGMEIQNKDYEAAVNAMMRAMEKIGWSTAERNQIFARLLETREQIVHD